VSLGLHDGQIDDRRPVDFDVRVQLCSLPSVESRTIGF
jgi:hypothetical protein